MQPPLAVLLIFVTPLWGGAAELPEGGKDLLVPKVRFVANPGDQGTAEEIEDGMRVRVARATPEMPWKATMTAAISGGAVAKGDRLLLSFMARRTDGSTGLVVGKAQLSGPPYVAVATANCAEFGGDWVRVNQPFVAEVEAPQGEAELTFFLGERVQTLEIAKVRLIDYGPDFDLAKLPRQAKTYLGREPDAPWRAAAFKRISMIREADMAVRLTDSAGKPLANRSVTVDLYRHRFGFGSCVTRDLLTNVGPDGEKYREIVARTFSRIVFENDLKPDSFPHDDDGRTKLEKSIHWLEENAISIRGHYLMQDAVDGWTRDRLGDPVKLKQELLDSVRERISTVGNRVVEWDVVNHPAAWQGAEMLHDKEDPLGNVDRAVFAEARQLTELPLCVNEDQLFRPGRQQDETFDYLVKLKSDGVRVDGLGNQAHFDSSFLPSPDAMLQVTDRFAAIAPKQVITEFDVVTQGDERLAADYLRDCLIMAFSHPAYDGFILWGFWQGSHWKPDAALWNIDWSPRPSAEVWEEWVGKKWHTQLIVKSDANGVIRWRGFKGIYRIEGGPTVVPGSVDGPVDVVLP